MNRWKALLLLYDQIDVRYPVSRWQRKHFVHRLTAAEVEEAEHSFLQFPLLVEELTEGRASVDYTIARIEYPLNSVSPIRWGGFWPAPADTRTALDRLAPRGSFDSVFVFWPPNDINSNRGLPSGGWGFGSGASDETNGATYATVANVRAEVWRRPRVGEIWLHEWLHGVCHHFAQQGHVMPDGDADGGDRHGYVHSATNGWSEYYRDLMNGWVREGNEWKGIASSGWLEPIAAKALPA